MCNQVESLNDFSQLDETVKIYLEDGKLLNATNHGAVTGLTVLPSGKYKNCKHKGVSLFVPKLS